MSAEPAVVRISSIEEAIEESWQRVLAGDASDVAAVIREMWPTLRLPADAVNELALIGLISKAEHDQRLRRRGHDRSLRPAVGWGSPPPKKWAAYIALTWPYEGADGQQRSLLTFDAADLAAFGARCRKMSLAYARRATFARQTLDRLNDHGCRRIMDLPPQVLAEVEVEALAALKARS